MVVTLGQQYNTGEKPTIMLYTYINGHAGTPDKNKTKTFRVYSTSNNSASTLHRLKLQALHGITALFKSIIMQGHQKTMNNYRRHDKLGYDCLQKNLEAFGAVPRKGKGRKWVAFVVVVKDGRDWMTAAKNVGMWHRGVERGAEALDSAWRRADLRQSNVQRQREVSEFIQELRVRLFCFALLLLFLCVFFLRYTEGESGVGPAPVLFCFRQLTSRDAPPCVCLSLSLFDLIAVPLSSLLHFIYFAVWRPRCPCPCLPIWVVLHCLYGCLSCPTLCGCPWFISLLFLGFPS